MKPYERFAAWREAHGAAVAVYKATESWPSHERFGLTAQVRRAAFSVAANLVEGSARRGSGEFRRFLDIARGSHAELTYALQLAHELGYLQDAAWKDLADRVERAGMLLWRLYDAVARRHRYP